VAALFLLGVCGVAVSHVGTIYAAGSASSTIGVVNYQLLVSKHPDSAKAEETMNAAVAKAKSDFDAKSAAMNDQDKQALYQQLQQGLQQTMQGLSGPINDKVTAAVKSVAEAKGLTIVLVNGATIYGGQDITDDVLKTFTAK